MYFGGNGNNEETEKKGYSYNLMSKNMPFHIMTAEKYTFMYKARTSPYSHNYIESPPPRASAQGVLLDLHRYHITQLKIPVCR